MLTWLRRHRRKFACGGAVLGGLYVAGRLAAWHVQRTREVEEAKLMETLKKRNHFSSTESTCVHTLHSLYSSLLNSLDEQLDADGILALLREKPPPEEKVRLWGDLKVVSISRCLVTIIASVYLAMMIRVQLNILAGQLYIIELSSQPSSLKITSRVQEKFLDICTVYSSRGVARLCQLVRRVVGESVEGIELNQKLSLEEVETIFNKVSRECLETQSEDNPVSNAGSYFFPEDNKYMAEFSSDDQVLLKQMFSDALDVIESEDTINLVKEVCRQGLAHLLDKIAQYYSAVGKSSRESSPSSSLNSPQGSHSEGDSSVDSGFVSPANISVHLAKLLPVITAQTRSCSEIGSDAWVAHLSDHPGCKVLGANVYEAFSTPKEVVKDEGLAGYFNSLSSYF